jgi:hypothetical protein
MTTRAASPMPSARSGSCFATGSLTLATRQDGEMTGVRAAAACYEALKSAVTGRRSGESSRTSAAGRRRRFVGRDLLRVSLLIQGKRDEGREMVSDGANAHRTR